MAAKILHHPAPLRRAFEAGGAHPALANWITAPLPADNDIRAALRTVRARSRSAAQNDDHMRLFLRMVESNVIGRVGVTVQARPQLISGKPDKAAAAAIEEAWAIQCERGNWDVTGQHSRNGCSRLGVRCVAQDGEALIRIHEFGADAPTGFAVELLDPEALDVDYNGELPNGNLIRMGVEMTPRRRPVAYWLFSESPSPHGGYRQTERQRVPADQILHVYLPEWVWSSRGVPWAASALRRMQMLSGYEEAAITAARAAAVKSAVYVQQEWAAPGGAPPGEQTAGGPVQELTPGAVEIAPYGWDLKPLDWSWPNTEHGAFVKEALRGIASGLGVSYNALANDLEGVNYSSLRQGALSERDLWMQLQDWWIEWVERPLYRRWLAHAIRTQSIVRRNGEPYDMGRFQALAAATFQGRRWPWVDPQKDIEAARAAIALGTRSISDVIRESGRDPEEVWAELRDDLDALRALGLPLADVLGGPAAAPSADPQSDTPASDAPGDAISPKDLNAYAMGVERLARLIDVPEPYVRRVTGIPAPEPGEESLRSVSTPPVTPPPTPDPGAPSND